VEGRKLSPLTEDKRSRIIALLSEGKLGRYKIAAKTGVSPGTVTAIKSHVTMGTNTEPSEAEEVIEATVTTFGLERDLQKALRLNIEHLEKGLKIIDGGKEKVTEIGRIDILAEDQQGEIVVIELKAGNATSGCVPQILSYMGSLGKKEKKPVRGILVAGDFPPRVVLAAQAVPSLRLKKYTFKFLFKNA